MKFTIEDTPTGFALLIESAHAEFESEHGLTHRRRIEMAGSHSPLAEAYSILERVHPEGPEDPTR